MMVPVSRVDRNPENPRILFRQAELEQLLESIAKYGVQVPISVYKDSGRYVLIDGERRLICSRKLNRKTIPALVQAKPTPLTNLLLMFNIHSLREQWDLLTIALKLPRVIDLLESEEGRPPNERMIAARTGLTLAVIRRCKLLIALPDQYKDAILAELNKPKPQQRLTEDFFIEMERALKTVERAMPEVLDNKDRVRKVLIDKFKEGVVKSRVNFRLVAKIARAERVEADRPTAKAVLRKVFQPNDYSIEQAYDDSVSGAYSERDLTTRVKSLIERLSEFNPEDADDDLRACLRDLIRVTERLLQGPPV
jgi:ParB family chromosome partitioning protein